MKVGSIVECVKSGRPLYDFEILHGVKVPMIGERGTVREFYVCGIDNKIHIRLEEFINPILTYSDGIGETAFDASRFRELLPPIENIEKYIEENTIVKPILEPVEL